MTKQIYSGQSSTILCSVLRLVQAIKEESRVAPAPGITSHMGPKIKYRTQKKYRSDVIATAQASGLILQFWNALLVGDDLTVISIVDDPEYAYLLDAIYDTSDIEEWKSFRFNYRGLSMLQGHK